MKAHLLYRDRDFDLRRPLPWNARALTQDLALDTLFRAMAGEDKFVLEVARTVVFSGLDSGIDDMLYRQEVLRDCLENATVVRELYGVAVNAVEEEKRHYLGSILGNHPGTVLRRSVAMIEAFLVMLRRLNKIARAGSGNFHSEGWRTFFAMVRHELDDAYFAGIEYHLARLKFRHGILLSTGLDQGNKAHRYVLRQPTARTGGGWRGCWHPSRWPFRSPCIRATRTAPGRCRNCATGGLPAWLARSPSPPTMSTVFSACCERNSRSMSAASACMND